MKYCTSYNQSKNIIAAVDEVRFPVHKLRNATVYAVEHPNQKIIVEIQDMTKNAQLTHATLENTITNTDNLYIDFYLLHDLVAFNKAIKNATISKTMYHYPATTWGLIQILRFYHVSDITIGEPLTFQLSKIKQNLRSIGIKIRVCPHVARQNIAKDIGIGVNHFFITPQATEFFEDYIDVFDIIDPDVNREEALVQVYMNHSYKGTSNLLISNIGTTLPSSVFNSEFFSNRLNCNQICMENEKNCHYCDLHLKIAEILQKNL